MRALVSGALGMGIVVDEPFRIRFADGRSEHCSAQGIRMLTQGCGDLQEHVVRDDAALDALVQSAARLDRLVKLARIALDTSEAVDVREEAREHYQLLFADDVSLDQILARLEAFGAEVSARALRALRQSERQAPASGAGRNYYEILGVSPDADLQTLKAAYRKLAMQLHPDTHPGNEEEFKRIGEAYAVLSDPGLRAAYDRDGKYERGGVGGVAGADFADLFNKIFGDRFQEADSEPLPRANRGEDLRYDVELTLEQAFEGHECEVVFSNGRTCAECGNSVAHGQTECPTCGVKVNSTDGRTLSVKVPAGIEDGSRIRLAGEGERSKDGGKPGDLYVFISVKSHALFERDGADLYYRAVVSMPVAALGGEMEVPTIDGERVRVAIPYGSQTGRRFRVRGKGMPRVHGGDRGNLNVELVVETPANLSPRQKEVLEEFAESLREDLHDNVVSGTGKDTQRE